MDRDLDVDVGVNVDMYVGVYICERMSVV